MSAIRSFVFYVVHWLITFVLSAVTVIIRPLGLDKSYRVGMLWSRLNLFFMRIICGLDLEVVRMGPVYPGPAVYISNHQSAWETIAYPTIFPPFMWVLKKELFYIPVFGWCLKALGHIGIDREMGLKSIKQINEAGERLLGMGYNIIIFPEGTRTAPGELREFNPGAVSLALKAGVPIVPVSHNAGLFWRRKEFAKRSGKITVVIDEPIPTAGISASARKELNRKVRDLISERLMEIGG